jgi:hypothetical protein
MSVRFNKQSWTDFILFVHGDVYTDMTEHYLLPEYTLRLFADTITNC